MLKYITSYFLTIFILCYGNTFSQNSHTINATLHPESNTINIQHEIVFINQSNDTLNSIYLHDWNNAYSHNATPLAKRFGEDFDKSFHLAKDEERGSTKIIAISDRNYNYLKWEREKVDIVKVQLNFPVYPKQAYELKLSYTVKLPDSRFTKYGYTKNKEYILRYWHVTPAVYENNEWKLYSNKNLDDLYDQNADSQVIFNYPTDYIVTSDLNIVQHKEVDNYNQTVLYGENRAATRLYIKHENEFTTHVKDSFSIVTNFESKDLDYIQRGLSIDKVISFVKSHLGDYPHSKLLVTEEDYKKKPLYGLNQLPSFLRPFPNEFQFEMRFLKTTLSNFLENTILMNPREEKWVSDAVQTYLMIKYVEHHYHDMKLLGKLSNIWGIRSFSMAKMDFNDQYTFLYMMMARRSLDQALTTHNDSLIKFNQKIANPYKAGVGLVYLKKYLEDDYVDRQIKEFYNTYKLKRTGSSAFIDLLKENPSKDIDWFFNEYINTRKKIDYKLKNLRKSKDSLWVTVKNKRGTNAPITLYGISKSDSIVSKQWLTGIKDEKVVGLEREGIKRLVLNYDKVIPEFNQRNNSKAINNLLGNRKIKFQFFKDVEDPLYNQVFYVPVFSFNKYDGLVTGMRLYNKTFLNRPFLYDIDPSYSPKENTLVGGAKFNFRQYIDEGNLYLINFKISGSTYHYAQDLRYSSITPEISFAFRTDDFRSNERQFLMSRFVNIIRDRSPDIDTDPDYSVFNTRYIYSNNGIINYKSWFADLQIADKFSKISFNWEFRKLYRNNRQINLRFFAGKFIHNKTESDFFSFALDRPTDYLFDYDYLGRSEASGIYSQQVIIAEGGFKSKLDHPFANDWMATANGSVNLWKWIEVYADAGFIDNKYESPRFVYDSGIRLNLVTDYFELYLPVYSNNGWEIAQENYSENIRFIITLSPRTLIGLFTRKWF